MREIVRGKVDIAPLSRKGPVERRGGAHHVARQLVRSDSDCACDPPPPPVTASLRARRHRDLTRELRAAAELQRSMLPGRAPAVRGLDIGFRCRPADTIGGDFFDFMRSGGDLSVAIGDVCGTGLAAALIVSMQKYVLRQAVKVGRSVDAPLRALNRILHDDMAIDFFVCLGLARYRAGKRTIEYYSAGLMPPLYASPHRRCCRFLPTDDPALGVQSVPLYTRHVLELLPRDVLVFYTDGVTEAFDPNGEAFGHARLRNIIRQNLGLKAQQLADAVEDNVLEHVAKGARDDLTIVVLKAAG